MVSYVCMYKRIKTKICSTLRKHSTKKWAQSTHMLKKSIANVVQFQAIDPTFVWRTASGVSFARHCWCFKWDEGGIAISQATTYTRAQLSHTWYQLLFILFLFCWRGHITDALHVLLSSIVCSTFGGSKWVRFFAFRLFAFSPFLLFLSFLLFRKNFQYMG